MAFKIAIPWKLTNGDILGTNVDEGGYLEWDAGTHYVVGDIRIFRPNNTLYECTLAHHNKTPANAVNIGVYWVLMAPTNRWRAFDYSSANNEFSRSLGPVGAPMIYLIKATNKTDTMAILMAGGSACAVDVIRNENPANGGTGTQRNLLAWSEDQFFGPWTKTNVVVTQPRAQDPWEAGATAMASGFPTVMDDGTASGLHYIESPQATLATGTQYTDSIFVKPVTGTRQLMLAMNPAFFSASPKAFFDLSAGTVASTSGGATATITPTTGGWYRATITATSTAAGSGWKMRAHMTNGATESYTGNNSRIAVCGSMTAQGALPLAYQWTRELTGGAGNVYGTRIYRDSKAINRLAGIEDGGGNVTDAIYTECGGVANDYINVAVFPPGLSENAVCSEIVFARSFLLGELLTPFSGTILDFSRKDRNEFGNVTLIPRISADQQTYTIKHDLSQRQYIKRVMKENAARAILFYDDTDLSNPKGQATFGFWTEYSDDVTAAPVVIASITVESMS
jgi:hypothetical protein